MVHFLDTSVNLATVRDSVLLPVAAAAAPSRSAIGIAYEDIFAVKPFEPRAIHVGVGPVALISVGLQVVSAEVATSILLPSFLFPLLLLDRQRPQRHNARVELYYEEDAEVRQQH